MCTMASFRSNPSPISISIFSFLLCSMVVIMEVAANSDEEYLKTHLHFYMHDTISGPNATAMIVVPNPSNASLFTFGVITTVDDLLTEGPNLTSKLIGRAQGLYSLVSQKGFDLLWTVNLVFLEGKYNGSTLAILASDAISLPVRELPVVGGTGYFRMARGYALLTTISINQTSGDAILELDVYVFHH